MVGRNISLKNPVTPPRIDPGTVRLVAQRLTHYATPGPLLKSNNILSHKNVNRYGQSVRVHLLNSIGNNHPFSIYVTVMLNQYSCKGAKRGK